MATDFFSFLRESAKKYGTQQELSRASGISQPMISRFLNGSHLRSDAIQALIDTLNITLVSSKEEQLNMKVINDYTAVPLVDNVGAGQPAVLGSEVVQSWFLVPKHTQTVRGRRNLIAAKILQTADSMMPTLSPGDIIIVDTDDKVVKKGRIYLVRNPNGEGLVKRVVAQEIPEDKDCRLTFYSDNAIEYPPESYSLQKDYDGNWEMAIVGRVVLAWSDMLNR